MNVPSRLLSAAVSLSLLTALAACGGGGANTSMSPVSTMPPPAVQTAQVPIVVSDDSTEDWAQITVAVQQIALVPQGGGTPVVVYQPTTPTSINLLQLDQLGEVLGSASVPVGSYVAAKLTIGANPGDVTLVASSDPSAGFPLAAGTQVPADQIQVQHASGPSGGRTATVNVSFASPLTVVAGSSSNALDLDFNLNHPAFIVNHTPVGGGTTVWAVNCDGPVRQVSVHDLSRLVLRHSYGTVASIASGGTSLTVNKDLPTLPVVNPETATPTGQTLTINVDATNGTLFYDVDAQTTSTVTSFATLTTLPGRYVRVAARYQADGTLVASRIWASDAFVNVWASPEGHVVQANGTTGILLVDNDLGQRVPMTVNAATQFFFRVPSSSLADTTPIGTGPAFMGQNLVRGFKVHAQAVDPLSEPLVAQTVDIEAARFDGSLTAANSTSLTYTRTFFNSADDYTQVLPYIASTSANGTDAGGAAITGFDYWSFAFPTVLTSGTNAIPDFVALANSGVNFGGAFGKVNVSAVSYAVWADPANPTGWAAPSAEIRPVKLPLGTVSTAFAGNSFAITEPQGANPVTVNVDTTSGSATLAYQIDRTNDSVTITAQDLTTAAGLAAVTNGLAAGAPVRVFGVPQSNGTMQAYVIAYFTGLPPAN
jgi:hypothetical protein